LLSREFDASAAEVSTIITVSTLAVALTAPFTGTVADVLGRKRVIVAAMFALAVPTVMVGLATSLSALIFWRAVQGLVLPPIFAVTVAYIGDEWPRQEATTAAGIYSSGSSLGGFSGRLVTGLLADLVGWRWGFFALAGIALAGAGAVAFLLPPERKFVRSEGLLASGRQMLAHFRNGQLVATYAVGFGVLFNFICTFTYISFHLAAPPYNLSASWLGALFVVYLAGSVLTPWTGWAVSRFGRRRFVVCVIALWIAGIALTLAPSLLLIVLGLAISAACGLVCQAISTAYVTITAKAGRSSAVGLYVTSFYVGGSFGAALGGIAWTLGGWPACAALVATMLVVMAGIVFFAWARRVPAAAVTPPIEPP
jgi:MFS transporter, YNFM family, putative membrane transport protein